MPLQPTPYTPIPYVRDTRTLGSLIGKHAESRAKREQERGLASQQMWSQIGQIAQNTVGGVLQEREADRAAKRLKALDDEAAADRQATRLEDQARITQEARQTHGLLRIANENKVPDIGDLLQLYPNDPDKAMAIHKGYTALYNPPVDLENEQAKYEFARDITIGFLEHPGELRAELWGGLRNQLLGTGWKPEELPKEYDEVFAQQLASFGATAQEQANYRPATFTMPDGRTVQGTFNQKDGGHYWGGVRIWGATPKPDAPKADRLVQVVQNGKNVWMPESEARGMTAPGTALVQKSATGEEKDNTGFFARMREATEVLEGPLSQHVANMGTISHGAQASSLWPTAWTSSEWQQYEQAQRVFTEARMRDESGAAVPPHEYEADRETYFAMPGNSPEVLRQKRKARLVLLGATARKAGRGLFEFYGDEEANRLLELYPMEPTDRPIRTIDGRYTVELPDGGSAIFDTEEEANSFIVALREKQASDAALQAESP